MVSVEVWAAMEGGATGRAANKMNQVTRQVRLAIFRWKSLAYFSSQSLVDNFYSRLHVDEFGAVDKKVLSAG
jgi:hypothetical protein